MTAKLPDAGALAGAERAAAENMRMANAARHYALSLNKAWLELRDCRPDDYVNLPKRCVGAQTDFVEQTFDH